jgi:ribosomal protein S18 acetylase RimI-like enzyme
MIAIDNGEFLAMSIKDEYEIKPLTANDIDAVIEIDRIAAGVSRRGYFEKRLVAATERPRDYIYVGLHSQGSLQGFAFAKLVNGEFGKPGASASLDAIGLKSEQTHMGLGQRLLDSIKEILVHKHVETLTSQVDWTNRSIMNFLVGAGFKLSPRLVLTRSIEEIPPVLEEEIVEDGIEEIDYSSPQSDDFAALSRDKVPVRSMIDKDLRKIIAIDKANTGIDRSEYYTRRLHESLHESGVRVSLVAELEDYPVGFIMARVDFGEFGHTSAEAVMDSIGVDPGYQEHGVGRALMSQLMANLTGLRVETVRTEIDWNDTGLIGYFDGVGFVPAQRITLSLNLDVL